MDGWMDGCMDGWIDTYMNICNISAAMPQALGHVMARGVPLLNMFMLELCCWNASRKLLKVTSLTNTGNPDIETHV